MSDKNYFFIVRLTEGQSAALAIFAKLDNRSKSNYFRTLLSTKINESLDNKDFMKEWEKFLRKQGEKVAREVEREFNKNPQKAMTKFEKEYWGGSLLPGETPEEGFYRLEHPEQRGQK